MKPRIDQLIAKVFNQLWCYLPFENCVILKPFQLKIFDILTKGNILVFELVDLLGKIDIFGVEWERE